MSRGRGHTKKSEAPSTAKIGEEHGQFVIRVPKRFEKIGMKLGEEITFDSCNTNPLNWQLVIKSNRQERHPTS